MSDEVKRDYDILDTLIIHRMGEVRPNDSIILMAVWDASWPVLPSVPLEACGNTPDPVYLNTDGFPILFY